MRTASSIQERNSFQTKGGGGDLQKGSCAGKPQKGILLPPLLPASPNPANSLQLLRGDPVVTLRAASPYTFKAPGVE